MKKYVEVMSLISDPVATAGDAGYMSTVRTETDIYNVLVLILFVLVFWVMWNVVRVVYRVMTDRSKW